MASQLKRLKLHGGMTCTGSCNISICPHWASHGHSREQSGRAPRMPVRRVYFSQRDQSMLQEGLLDQVLNIFTPNDQVCPRLRFQYFFNLNFLFKVDNVGISKVFSFMRNITMKSTLHLPPAPTPLRNTWPPQMETSNPVNCPKSEATEKSQSMSAPALRAWPLSPVLKWNGGWSHMSLNCVYSCVPLLLCLYGTQACICIPLRSVDVVSGIWVWIHHHFLAFLSKLLILSESHSLPLS